MNGCIKCGNVNEWAGYIYGFCDACAKSILEASAKRLRRKSQTAAPDKRLEQDIARANAALAALATAEGRVRLRDEPTPSPEAVASLRSAIQSEEKRLRRAICDHRLLWNIYRRTDKTTPYWQSAESQPAVEPQSVAQPEGELVAA
jgi:hypothetical protein